MRLKVKPIKILPMMNDRVSILLKTTVSLLMLLSACKQKNMSEIIQRNQGINILLLETKSFLEFRDSVAMNTSSFILNISKRMYKDNSSVHELPYDATFEKLFCNSSEIKLIHSAFREELEVVHSSGVFGKNQIGLFESLLMFTSSYYFKEFYFAVPKYTPPIKYSFIFKSVFREIENTLPNDIEYINPFYPYCDQLEQAGIYYVLLRPKIIKEILQEFSEKIPLDIDSEYSVDYLFIKEFLEKARSERLQVLLQLTP